MLGPSAGPGDGVRRRRGGALKFTQPVTRNDDYVISPTSDPGAVSPHDQRSPGLGPLVSIWVALCLCLVVGGLVVSTVWMTRPGAATAGPATWPDASQLRRAEGRHTLLVFAHPHCVCTAATLRELAQIVSRCQDRLTVHVVFCAPPGAEEGWEQSDLWRHAEELPGVSVIADLDGLEARRFGAHTSGATYLFDATGALRFAGGITSSRGHEGDNEGRSAVIDHVLGREPGRATTFVYGCALFGDEPPPPDPPAEEQLP